VFFLSSSLCVDAISGLLQAVQDKQVDFTIVNFDDSVGLHCQPSRMDCCRSWPSPWVIQDILPTVAAVSRIDSSAVQITFFLFFIIFTALLIAELRIMFKQIKIDLKREENSYD
jgi:hypothetical protein